MKYSDFAKLADIVLNFLCNNPYIDEHIFRRVNSVNISPGQLNEILQDFIAKGFVTRGTSKPSIIKVTAEGRKFHEFSGYEKSIPKDTLQSKQISSGNSDKIITGNDEVNTKKIFISYSWDTEEHKLWVKHLADRLCSNGIDVLLDQYELRIGSNLNHFMEDLLKIADKVIIIFTPQYKSRAENRERGVGYEYSIITQEVYASQLNNNKLLPILKFGTSAESIPSIFKSFIYANFTVQENFEMDKALIHQIYDEPLIKKPKLGKRPNFVNLNELKPIIGEQVTFDLRELMISNLPVVSKLKINDTPTLTLAGGVQINVGIIRIQADELIYYTTLGLSTIWKPNMTDFELETAEKLRELPEGELMNKGYINSLTLSEIKSINR